MMGVGSLSAEAETDPRDRLEEVFDWHLTPGTYEQKEYAMQNPGEWVRIEDLKKPGSQKNQYGIRKRGTLSLVRLICYDKNEQNFLYEERVADFEEEDSLEIDSWLIPIMILIITITLGILISYTLFDMKEVPTIIIFILGLIFNVSLSAYYNLILMWSQILVIVLALVTIRRKK